MLNKPHVKKWMRAQQTRFPFLLDAKYRAQRIWRNARKRPFEPEFKIIQYIKFTPGQVAIDIGANRGQSIDAIRLFKPDIPIISFEANIELAKRLKIMFRDIDSVQIRAGGLGDINCEKTLYIPYYRGWMFDGLASLDRKSAEEWITPERMSGFNSNQINIEERKVKIETLDSQRLNPAFIKIDVQGFEEQVIRGGRVTIENCKPVLIIEHEEAPSSIFSELGYKEFALDDQILKLVDHDGARKSNSIYLSECHVQHLTDTAPHLLGK